MRERFGSYVILEELGRGGMAQVHLAEGRVAGRRVQVALKRMLPHVAGNAEMRALFINEARLASTLRHPNIAAIHECGTHEDVPFIAFEFVPGPTVEQLARQCATCVGHIPIAVVLNIACQLCEALHHAHDFGIVHRDVTPQNLIVSSHGVVKLIDFGLAKAKHSTIVSQAGIIKGKLRYVAPEYIAGTIDSRSDLWATGIVVHELLTGERLFDGVEDAETVELIRSQPIAPPSKLNPEVSKELDDIVRTCLQRDPARRWRSAATLRSAFFAEAKKLGSLSKPHLVAWVEWAFSQNQPQREDSAVVALAGIVESRELELVDDTLDDAETVMFRLPASSAAMMARRRDSVAGVAQTQPVQRPEPVTAARPPKSTRVWWLVVALLLVIAAVAVWRLRFAH